MAVWRLAGALALTMACGKSTRGVADAGPPSEAACLAVHQRRIEFNTNRAELEKRTPIFVEGCVITNTETEVACALAAADAVSFYECLSERPAIWW